MVNAKRSLRRKRAVLSAILCCILFILLAFTGCTETGAAGQPASNTAQTAESSEQTEPESQPETEPESEPGTEPESQPGSKPETEPESQPGSVPESQPEVPQIDENGSYTTKEDVALYLYVYGKLPPNFMTKKEAQRLGWNGGSLEDYAPGMCIGGDYFGNYEGVLPKGNYRECDIDTLGKKKRGAKRIIYSDDGRIYYTEDHYETFELLYGEETGEE